MTKPTKPDGLRERGSKLWDSLVKDDMPADQAEVLVEVCRTADRAEEVDKIIRGKEAVDLMAFEFDVEGDVLEAKVVLDSALNEGRQQATMLKQLLVVLRQMDAGSVPTQQSGGRGRVPGSNPARTAKTEDQPADELKERRGWRSA